MKTLRILVVLYFAILFAACSKTENNRDIDDNDGNKKGIISTVIIKTNKGIENVDLGEGSTICFTDGYMIIKSSGKETTLSLKDLTHISYK